MDYPSRTNNPSQVYKRPLFNFRTDNSSDFIRLFRRILDGLFVSNSHETEKVIPFFLPTLVPSVFSLFKRHWDEVVFFLKSLALERVRCIGGFVEQKV